MALVPEITEKLKEYASYIDHHRILVFNYKIATLYFGSGDYNTSIDYLQLIINDHVDLRYDLQCYARLVHLLAHYELGNYELMESLTKSVYRFMAKMKNLTVVEEEMFKFLRKSFQISQKGNQSRTGKIPQQDQTSRKESYRNPFLRLSRYHLLAGKQTAGKNHE